MNKKLKTSLKIGGVLLGIALLVVVSGIVWFYADQRQMFSDPVFDTAAPELPPLQSDKAMLVFSKTNGFRHRDGIAGGLVAFEKLAEELGWDMFATENGAVFNAEQLSRFDAIVWLCTTGPALTAKQQNAFQTYLENGGGYIGLHAAGDGSHKDWSWYVNEVIGASFVGHPINPQFQDAVVTVETPSHPTMNHLPTTFSHNEEWYGFKKSPRRTGLTVLATVDEKTYEPQYTAMGGDHPVIWVHPQGQGRVFYSAFGHQASAYDSRDYMQVLNKALLWVARN